MAALIRASLAAVTAFVPGAVAHAVPYVHQTFRALTQDDVAPYALLITAASPIIVGVPVGIFKLVELVVHRRRSTATPPQGQAPPPETPLERERGERIEDLERDLKDARRHLTRVERERAMYREELARRGFEFIDAQERQDKE